MGLDGVLKKLKNVYGNMRDWSGYCAPISKCKSGCCTSSFGMSYIEFEYGLEFLRKRHSEQEIKEILTRNPEPRKVVAISLERTGPGYKLGSQKYENCRFLSEHRCLIYEARMFACRAYKNTGNNLKPLCMPEEELGEYSRENEKAGKRIISLTKELDLTNELKDEHPLNFWVDKYLDTKSLKNSFWYG